MVQLTKQDRENIANMPDDAIGMYACFTDNMSKELREAWMLEGYEPKSTK
jgi:HPt (histidine-containing phosphotransfer) domain-containing protein